MKKIFFDTETTGLTPGQIGQLAFIEELDTGEIKTGNYFFSVDYVTRGAFEVTGKDAEFYKEASEGAKFTDKATEIAERFSNSTLIAHNVDFDMNFLNMEMFRANASLVNCSKFDTMKYFADICKIPNPRNRNKYKNPKLVEMVESFSINKDKIAEYCDKIFRNNSETFHGAMYDTTAMFIVFKVHQETINNSGTAWRDYFCNKGA